MYVYRCPRCPAHVALRLTDQLLHAPECVPCDCTMKFLPDSEKALLPLDPPACTHQGRRTSVWSAGIHTWHCYDCNAPLAGDTRQAAGLSPMKVEHLHAAGILLPETQDALEWLYKQRHTNGMAEAFCKVGGRRCIDLVAFARLMREQRA